MKNLIAIITSLFVLTIILTVVSVQAQSLRKYQAQIPFDFKIGKTTYRAGNYVINVERNGIGDILILKSSDNHNLKKMAVLENGSRSLVDKTVLMFDRYGDKYVLKKMVAPDFGFAVPHANVKKWIAKNSVIPEESVAVVMTKRNETIE